MVEAHGTPPLWKRPTGFPTLVHLILEQQVSIASARAVFDRLAALAAPLTPEAFLALADDELRALGFSRQKTRYTRALAQAVAGGELRLEALVAMPDDEVMSALTRLPGIGPWTASAYLLMALRRPDAWPAGDLALAVGVEKLLALDRRPKPSELEVIAERWRPWRAVAARIVWFDYLGGVTPRGAVLYARSGAAPGEEGS